MARILVTGGAGFIGGYVCELLLARGHQVLVLDNESTGTKTNVPSEAVYRVGDVRDSGALDGAFAFGGGLDAVYHIAGQASIRLSYSDPAADLGVNTMGTVNVLQACIKYRVPRLLFASSMTVYGAEPPAPTPETTDTKPISYYALTNLAAEHYVMATALRPDLDFDLRVTAFRMFNVYGPRQSLTNAYQGVFAIFVGNVLRGEPITIYSDGEQSRDLVHVRDVARAWGDALDAQDSVGQVINIGTGVPTSVNTLADTVLAAFGHTRESYPVQYRPAHAGDMRVSRADIQRAANLLNWKPMIPVTEGMTETIAWAKGQFAP